MRSHLGNHISVIDAALARFSTAGYLGNPILILILMKGTFVFYNPRRFGKRGLCCERTTSVFVESGA